MTDQERTQKCKAIKAEFVLRGISLWDWARRHGFEYQTVVDVLNGRLKGKRGEAHRVAVALKLKPDCRGDIKL